MSNWKNLERSVAKYFGGERVPITGRIRGSAPDVDHDVLSFEVKFREKLPAWMIDAMAQAVASMKDKDMIPTVVYKEKQKSLKNSYVMLRARDFKHIMETYYERSKQD